MNIPTDLETLIGGSATALAGGIGFIFNRQDRLIKKLRKELLILRSEDKLSISKAHQRLDHMNDLVVRRSDFDKQIDVLRYDIKELKNDILGRLDRIEKRSN